MQACLPAVVPCKPHLDRAEDVREGLPSARRVPGEGGVEIAV